MRLEKKKAKQQSINENTADYPIPPLHENNPSLEPPTAKPLYIPIEWFKLIKLQPHISLSQNSWIFVKNEGWKN